jgi:hypothetical protein
MHLRLLTITSLIAGIGLANGLTLSTAMHKAKTRSCESIL